MSNGMINLVCYELPAQDIISLRKVLKAVLGLGKDSYVLHQYQESDDVTELLFKWADPACTVIVLSMSMPERLGLSKSVDYCRNNPVKLDNGTTLYFTYSYPHVQKFKHKLQTFCQDIDRFINDSLHPILRKNEFKVLNTVQEVEAFFANVAVECSVICFDFETSGLNYWSADFCATCLSVCVVPGFSYIIPLYHPESPFTVEDCTAVLQSFERYILSNYHLVKVGHNIKFDLHVCKYYGLIKLRGRFDDTMLMAHLLNENRKVGLKELVAYYYPQFQGYDIKTNDWRNVPYSSLLPYASADTDATFRLFVQFETELLKDERVYRIYRNLQLPLLKTLLDMEHTGQLIDRAGMQAGLEDAKKLIKETEQTLLAHPAVVRLSEHYTKQALYDLKSKIVERLSKLKPTTKTAIKLQEQLCSVNYYLNLPVEELPESIVIQVNLNSTKQLEDLFYYSDHGFQIHLTVVSTDKNAIKEIIEQLHPNDPLHEWFNDFIAYRSMQKTASTYLKAILEGLDSNDYLHGSFLQHGTVTGRLSSSNPNLQNLPDYKRVKNEKAKHVCKAVKQNFIVPAGYTFMQCDLSQAELRLAAEFSGDPNMIEAYRTEGDLHIITAATIAKLTMNEFKELPKDTQKEYRTKAKSANFGLLYGMQPETYQVYAKQNYNVVMTDDEARKAHKAFFAKYPYLLDYHANYQGKAQKFGHVRTLFGRKRHLPNVHSTNQRLQSDALRQAINSPIQGTQAEFTCLLLIMLKMKLPTCIFVNTIHDSIILYVPTDSVAEVSAIITSTCEHLNDQCLYYFGKQLKHVNMKIDIEKSTTNWTELVA